MPYWQLTVSLNNTHTEAGLGITQGTVSHSRILVGYILLIAILLNENEVWKCKCRKFLSVNYHVFMPWHTSQHLWSFLCFSAHECTTNKFMYWGSASACWRVPTFPSFFFRKANFSGKSKIWGQCDPVVLEYEVMRSPMSSRGAALVWGSLDLNWPWESLDGIYKKVLVVV